MFGSRTQEKQNRLKKALCDITDLNQALCESCVDTLVALANVPGVTTPDEKINKLVDQLKEIN